MKLTLRQLWQTLFIVVILMFIIGVATDGTDVSYYQHRMERYMADGDYEKALEVGEESDATDAQLTQLRIEALRKTHQLGDRLFAYPVVGNNKGMNNLKGDDELCAYLINRQLDKFAEALPRYYAINDSLPRHYQEAYPSAKLVYDQLATKQDALVSGTNIKTINSTSLLGSGDVTVASTDLNNLSNTGKIAIAHNAMPSGTYEEVTVGATGTQYQAPADGYFAVVSGAATGEDWVCIFNTTTMLGSYVQTPIGWDYQKIFIPVKKNDYVQLDYGNVTIRNFRFIYAVGSESEAN